ncbi:MAG: malate dehydrogenase, partial [Methanoregula sp.]
VLGDENRILTVSSYVKSEVHGIGGVCIGVPARINRNGAFPVTIRIDESEVIAYRESVEKIRTTIHEIVEKLKSEKDLGAPRKPKRSQPGKSDL